MIEPFKYLIQPVAIERNDEGRVIAERPGQVVTVFTAEDAARAVTEFEAALKQLTAGEEGSNGDDQHAQRHAVRD